MKKLNCLIIILLAFTTTRAQKIKIDSGKIYTDEKVYAIMEKDGCKAFAATCQYTIKNTDNKPVLVIKFENEKVETERKPANPDGNVFYANFIFLGSKQKAQKARIRMKEEKVAEEIVKAHLFANGQLDQEAADNFVLVNPVVYGLPKQEAIIKEKASAPTYQSTINVHF